LDVSSAGEERTSGSLVQPEQPGNDRATSVNEANQKFVEQMGIAIASAIWMLEKLNGPTNPPFD